MTCSKNIGIAVSLLLCLPCATYLGQDVRAKAVPGEISRQAADTLVLTVDELLRRGVESSVILRTDTLKEEIAAAGVREVRTAMLPDVQVGLKGGYLGQPVVFLHGLEDATRPDSPHWNQNYTLDVNQPLYQGGKIRKTVRKAEIGHGIARLQTDADAAEIKLGLIGKYLDLMCLYKQYRVMRQNIWESERRLQDIKRMKDEGLITQNDVLRSELKLSNDRISLRQTENSIILASQELDILLGIDEDTVILPDSASVAPACLAESYNSCVLAACDADPSARIAMARIADAENDVSIARSEYMPKVSLYAGNTLARPIERTMADMFSNSWSIGLNITYPISSLYRNRSKVAQMRRTVDVMTETLELTRQNIRMEVKDAWLRHEEAVGQVSTLELSVRQAEENYRIMRNRYFGQLCILTDLLDADSLRLEAELRLTEARTKVIYTYYRLQKACGRL